MTTDQHDTGQRPNLARCSSCHHLVDLNDETAVDDHLTREAATTYARIADAIEEADRHREAVQRAEHRDRLGPRPDARPSHMRPSTTQKPTKLPAPGRSDGGRRRLASGRERRGAPRLPSLSLAKISRLDEASLAAAELVLGLGMQVASGRDRARNGAEPIDLAPARALLRDLAQLRTDRGRSVRTVRPHAPELVSMREAARLAGVPASTLGGWIGAALLRPRGRVRKTPGGPLHEVFAVADVEVVKRAKERER